MWLIDQQDKNFVREYDLKLNEEYIGDVIEILKGHLKEHRTTMFTDEELISTVKKDAREKISHSFEVPTFIYSFQTEESIKLSKKYLAKQTKNNRKFIYTEFTKYLIQYTKPFTDRLIVNLLKNNYDFEDFIESSENPMLTRLYISCLEKRQFYPISEMHSLVSKYVKDIDNFLLLATELENKPELLEILISQFPDILEFKKVFSYVDLEEKENGEKWVKWVNIDELDKAMKKYGKSTCCKDPRLILPIAYANEAKSNDEIIKKLQFQPHSIIKKNSK